VLGFQGTGLSISVFYVVIAGGAAVIAIVIVMSLMLRRRRYRQNSFGEISIVPAPPPAFRGFVSDHNNAHEIT
jgi:hypothetical protein